MYGANLSLCHLINVLKRDFQIKPIVIIPNEGEITHFLKENNITYYISHFYWWVNSNKGLFQYLLNWRKQLINYLRIGQYTRLIKNHNVQLVYSNSITINIGGLLSRRLNCPHVWHIRESMIQFNFKFSMGNSPSKLFLKNYADRFILISDYLQESYKNILPQHKTIRVYNGIDFSKEYSKLKPNNNFVNLCLVGVISEQKNQLDALKALKILVHQHEVKNVILNLIGGSQFEYLNKIKNYIEENQLDNFVKFHGHSSNVHELLPSMDIGLMCSRDEAFGRVTIEYMLHKMPVIASNSGANQELVKDSENGFIYPIYNVSKLAELILWYVQNPAKNQNDGYKAYEYAKQNFSLSTTAELIYNQINQLVKG